MYCLLAQAYTRTRLWILSRCRGSGARGPGHGGIAASQHSQHSQHVIDRITRTKRWKCDLRTGYEAGEVGEEMEGTLREWRSNRFTETPRGRCMPKLHARCGLYNIVHSIVRRDDTSTSSEALASAGRIASHERWSRGQHHRIAVGAISGFHGSQRSNYDWEPISGHIMTTRNAIRSRREKWSRGHCGRRHGTAVRPTASMETRKAGRANQFWMDSCLLETIGVAH